MNLCDETWRAMGATAHAQGMGTKTNQLGTKRKGYGRITERRPRAGRCSYSYVVGWTEVDQRSDENTPHEPTNHVSDRSKGWLYKYILLTNISGSSKSILYSYLDIPSTILVFALENLTTIGAFLTNLSALHLSQPANILKIWPRVYLSTAIVLV